MLRLPPLPTTSELIKIYGLSAKQQLSQNFLLDLNITDKIARARGPLEGKYVFEVGPGPGSLTRSLLKLRPSTVSVVEKDSRFIPALETIQSAVPKGMVRIHRGDILEVNETNILNEAGAPKIPWQSTMDKGLIIGNLPFGVATELLVKWMHCIPSKSGPFVFGRMPMILMFQKEVAQRICAKPKTKEYGRLSVLVQNFCTAKCLFDIDGNAFVPPPKVKATVVSIEPLITPIAQVNISALELVLRQVFGQRRKALSNSIKTLGEDAIELCHSANIDPTVRCETLTIPQWCDLANAYESWPKRPSDSLTPFDNELKRLYNMSYPPHPIL